MATCTIEIAGTEFEMEFDARVTSRGCPAKLSGPPEDCYPAEAAEYEVSDVRLFKLVLAEAAGVPGESGFIPRRWVRGDELPVNDQWLLDLLEAYAYDSDEAQQAVDEEIDESDGPDPDDAYDRWRDDRAEYESDMAQRDREGGL